MTVYAAGDDIIASGSADHTVRLWDLRSQRCIDVIAPGDSGVASVCVNHLGSLLASGTYFMLHHNAILLSLHFKRQHKSVEFYCASNNFIT